MGGAIDTVQGLARLVVVGVGSCVVGVMLGVWVVRPHPFEGPSILSILPNHGIHLGDLLGVLVAAFLVGLIVSFSRLID
jgi:hypothetical protein